MSFRHYIGIAAAVAVGIVVAVLILRATDVIGDGDDRAGNPCPRNAAPWKLPARCHR